MAAPSWVLGIFRFKVTHHGQQRVFSDGLGVGFVSLGVFVVIGKVRRLV